MNVRKVIGDHERSQGGGRGFFPKEEYCILETSRRIITKEITSDLCQSNGGLGLKSRLSADGQAGDWK